MAQRTVTVLLVLGLCTGCQLKAHKLADGVWALVGEKGLANSGVIRTEHGPVVVDTQLTPETARALRDQAKKLTGWENTAYVVNTSHLPSHAFGNTVFVKAEIIGHDRVRRDLLEHGPGLLERLQKEDPRLDGLKDTRIAAPTLTFDKRTAIHAPDRTIHIIHVGPGLTAGDSVVLLPKEKIVFAGDLVCLGTMPWIEYANTSAWLDALDRLAALKFDTLIPGHGAVTDRSGIERIRAVVRQFRRRVTQARRAGKDLEAAKKAVAFPLCKEWVHYERARALIVEHVWGELERENSVSSKSESQP